MKPERADTDNLGGELRLLDQPSDPASYLGREPLEVSTTPFLSRFTGERILVTGAGGSIGRALVDTLLQGSPSELILLDHEENALFEVEELARLKAEPASTSSVPHATDRVTVPTITPLLCDLKDRHLVDRLVSVSRPTIIFHAAAYKHVALLEANPIAAIANNLFGTRNLLDSAIRHRIPRLVFISTDKAVDPISVYGASKMLAEELVLHVPRESIEVVAVRFGNVLDSRGSIMPLFRRQLARGGPITVTDPEATRYFMTLSESASLVIEAGATGTAGRLYVLDMGEPVRIGTLAETAIRLAGRNRGSNADINIQTIGLRPGERLHESLYAADEIPEPTETPHIRRLKRTPRFGDHLESIFDELESVCFRRPGCEHRFYDQTFMRDRLAHWITTMPRTTEPSYAIRNR